jgi:fatty-acyl-CoA synthase
MKLGYSDIWRAIAAAYPERSAVSGGGRALTYAELADRAGRLVGLLRDGGIRPGDRVAVFLPNRPEYLVTLFATLALGATPVPINFRYRASELAALLVDCDASALVYPRSLADTIRELPSRVASEGSVRLWLRVDDAAEPASVREDEIPFDAIEALPSAAVPAAPPDGELFLYTGGTTGAPKAVVWGAEDLLDVQLYSIYGALGIAQPESLEQIVDIAGRPDTPVPVTMPLAPLMHGTALFNSMNTLVLGGAIVMTSSAHFDAHAALELARERGVTRLIVAGDAIAAPLADAAEEAGTLPSLTSVMSSGMRFSDPVKARLHGLGDLTITDILASTEGGPYALAASRSAADLPARLRLFPGAVVLDENDQEVQDVPGAKGVLAFRGTIPRGYHGDPEKTAAAFRTIRGRRHVVAGDLVRVRGDGVVDLLGRGSSVVNTGGEKVYPAEVEEALLSHPGVRDAIVLGVPDPRFGEVVAAVVAAEPGARLDADALRAHVGAQLAGYKKPRIVDIRADLGRSPSGKADMRRLREELMALGSPAP